MIKILLIFINIYSWRQGNISYIAIATVI